MVERSPGSGPTGVTMSARELLLPTVLLTAVLGGCSAEYAMDAVPGEADSDRHATEDTAEEDPDTGEPEEPAWYVVRADLAVVGGVASEVGAVVAVEIIDADLQRIDCVVDLAADLVSAGPVDAEAGLVWWDVSVRASPAPCAPLPAVLSLGVGALHPDARARLGTVGHDGIADSLYGAWLRADAGEPMAYGYAGTAADLLGDDPSVLPPPDGTYRLAPLYVVPLPAP